MWFRPSARARRTMPRHPQHWSRRLILERLEDRVVPSHPAGTTPIASPGSYSLLTGVILRTPASTSTLLSSPANPAVFGQSVTVTATISKQGLSAGQPTGTVQFQVDGSNAGNPVNVTTSGGLTTASFRTAGLAVGTHILTARYGGDGNFAASTGTLPGGQLVNQAITTTAITSTLVAAVFGQTLTFTATISVQGPGAGTPTGSVQFKIDGNPSGSPMIVTTSNGVTSASMTTTGLAVGMHTISAAYAGDGNFLASTGTLAGGLSVNQASSTVALSTSATAAVFGQPLTLTAIISVQGPGTGTPTGSVQFKIDGNAFGSPVVIGASNGVIAASVTTAGLAVGNHTVTASYSGDVNFSSSAATLAGGQLVNQATTTTAVKSSIGSSVFGQMVTWTATVSVMAPGAGTPTGTVQFQIDGSNVGTPVNVNTSGGVTTASFNSAGLTAGTHLVTASYGGDGSFATSSGPLTGGQVVNKAGTAIAVTSSAAPSVFGQSVIFTATISIQSPGAGVPTGTVQFQVDSSNLGNPVNINTFGGVTTASFSTTGLTAGTHVITASYGGDGNFNTCSGPLTGGQIVSQAGTTLVVSTSAAASVFGQSVTFTATISIQGLGAGTPTGTVQFLIDGKAFGGPIPVITSAGVASATLIPATLAVGTHTVTAGYSGDGSFAAASGTLSASQTVNKAGTALALTTSVNVSVTGQPVTFTANISVTAPGAGTPTGTIQFLVDGSNAGSPMSLKTSAGVTSASVTTAALPVGMHTVAASYSSDSGFIASSGTLSGGQEVDKAVTATTIASTTNASVYGQAITLTATIGVSAPGGGTPTGMVQFQVDGINLGGAVSVSTTGGVTMAALSTSALAVGAHAVMAAYSGNGSFGSSTSTLGGGLTVNKSNTGALAGSSANISVYGQSVAFTVAITAMAPGSGTPTGTVQFQIDGANFGSPVSLSGGTAASMATTSLTVTNHAIKAIYSGDANFLASSGTLAQTVNQAFTKVGVTSSANASAFGQMVAFTATISVLNPGAGSPTGAVSFQIDGSAGNAVSISSSGGVSTAVYSTSGLTVGTHDIRVTYGGDSNFVTSSGGLSGGQVVNKATTATAVASSINPSLYGQTVTFMAVVNVQGAGAGAPTGTVQFQIDGSPFGTPAAINTSGGQNMASFSTPVLTVGTHTVTASYNADPSFAASSGLQSSGQMVKPNGVLVLQSPTSGVLNITGDTGKNAITITPASAGVLRIAGDPVSAPATPTHVNNTDFMDFTLTSVTGINIQYLNGNDRVTMKGFSVPGDISISAGSGSDTFSLDTVTARGIAVMGTGPDAINVNNVLAKNDLDLSAGAGSQSVSVTGSTSLDLNIHGHSGFGDNLNFNLQNDTVTDSNYGGLTLDDSHGAGNDTVMASHVKVAYQLALTLGGGINNVSADHVTCLFGFIDGGEPNSGSNLYFDGGDNVGYYITHFVGH